MLGCSVAAYMMHCTTTSTLRRPIGAARVHRMSARRRLHTRPSVMRLACQRLQLTVSCSRSHFGSLRGWHNGSAASQHSCSTALLLLLLVVLVVVWLGVLGCHLPSSGSSSGCRMRLSSSSSSSCRQYYRVQTSQQQCMQHGCVQCCRWCTCLPTALLLLLAAQGLAALLLLLVLQQVPAPSACL